MNEEEEEEEEEVVEVVEVVDEEDDDEADDSGGEQEEEEAKEKPRIVCEVVQLSVSARTLSEGRDSRWGHYARKAQERYKVDLKDLNQWVVQVFAADRGRNAHLVETAVHQMVHEDVQVRSLTSLNGAGGPGIDVAGIPYTVSWTVYTERALEEREKMAALDAFNGAVDEGLGGGGSRQVFAADAIDGEGRWLEMFEDMLRDERVPKHMLERLSKLYDDGKKRKRQEVLKRVLMDRFPTA